MYDTYGRGHIEVCIYNFSLCLFCKVINYNSQQYK